MAPHTASSLPILIVLGKRWAHADRGFSPPQELRMSGVRTRLRSELPESFDASAQLMPIELEFEASSRVLLPAKHIAGRC